nr:unnamed protein product [Digitaria exilis]
MYGVGGGGGGFNAPSTTSGRRRNPGDEEEDEEEETGEGRVLEAWERAYADDRSWEALQEDESGLLRPIDTKTLVHAQYRRRLLLRSAADAAVRIQKGLIRYLYIVIDLSRAASEMDYRPSRMAVVAKHAEAFIREFFDQNPLSHVGLVTIKDGISHRLTDIGGSPESQIKALLGKLECSGDSSLQNALELVHGYLDQVPSYGHKEVLILYSALNTCDPGDIMETIEKCKKSKIRCSIIGLAAEIFICKHICEETGGSYTVALDEMDKRASMFAAQNAANTSAWIAIFTSMRACTIAQVARVNAVSHRSEMQLRVLFRFAYKPGCISELDYMK